jgi:argininosuccinate lyase
MRLLREALRFQAILLRRAHRFADTVMPIYTHYQAALPVTYGHYLGGIAEALERDVASIIALGDALNHCPLGAGAAGGTSFPINPDRAARLLGFDHPVAHSIDAVASRDLILRLLSAATILGVTLSRLAADLLLWTTAEFGFLTLPDELVGSSSMMPQKRNPFLLEHVLGRSASPLGSFVASATAMHAKPFTNSIAVGTEAVAPVWQALHNITEALTLARLVVAGAMPQPQAMLKRAEEGYVVATELANRLVTDGQMSFRSAHHTVGTIVREALEHGGESLQEAATRQLEAEGIPVSIQNLDPGSVARLSEYGGGPSPKVLVARLETLTANWAEHRRYVRSQAQAWQTAEARLDEAIQQLAPSDAIGGDHQS